MRIVLRDSRHSPARVVDGPVGRRFYCVTSRQSTLGLFPLSNKAKHLVVFLHGLGGSGASFAPLIMSWRSTMPDTAFASPDAPFMHPRSGHQWFGVDGRELMPDRIATVRAAFDRVVQGSVKPFGFDGRLENVALVGVSQGAIVALDAVASGRWQVGVLVTFAGLLPPMTISPEAIGTTVLLIHGEEDTTICAAETRSAAKRLNAAGIEVESHIFPGTGHTVSLDGLQLAKSFLVRRFFGQ
jgi:phospholipase/carboxylesterase